MNLEENSPETKLLENFNWTTEMRQDFLLCSANFWVQVSPLVKVSALMVACVNDSLIQAVYLWACTAGLDTRETRCHE